MSESRIKLENGDRGERSSAMPAGIKLGDRGERFTAMPGN